MYMHAHVNNIEIVTYTYYFIIFKNDIYIIEIYVLLIYVLCKHIII